MQYQNCLKGIIQFGQIVTITGDNGKTKNGCDYDVSGKNKNAVSKNTTWTQKNVKTNFERKIFRYKLKDAIPFPKE